MAKQECDKTKFNIPKYEIEALARAFLPALLNYYRIQKKGVKFENEKKALETSDNENDF